MHLIESTWGGGTRGVIPSRFWHHLEVRIPGLRDHFSHFAGASTGSLVAAGIASGMSGADMVHLFQDQSWRIFYDTLVDNVMDFGILRGAQYSTEGLRDALIAVFGDMTLGELEKRVLIPTVAFDRLLKIDDQEVRLAAMKFLHNWPDSKDLAIGVVDALRWSCAAPIYFPLVIGTLYGRRMPFGDGGLGNNNPADSAIAEALEQGIPREEIYCLSLGTGINPFYIEAPEGKEALDMGLLEWGKKGRIFHAMMDPPSMASDFRAKAMIPKGHFHQVNPVLLKETPLDSVDAIPELIAIADAIDIEPTVKWLEGILEPAA